MSIPYSSLSFFQRNLIPLIPGKVSGMLSSETFKRNIADPSIREHALQEINNFFADFFSKMNICNNCRLNEFINPKLYNEKFMMIPILAISASATIYCGIQTLSADNTYPKKPESTSDIALKVIASGACIFTGITAALLIPIAFQDLKLSRKIAHIVSTGNI